MLVSFRQHPVNTTSLTAFSACQETTVILTIHVAMEETARVEISRPLLNSSSMSGTRQA
jgi:hypothetical protein